MNFIKTEELSAHLRNKAINLEKKQILLTRFTGTEQEKDLRESPNCNGFGRVRHFKLSREEDWPNNPLPILPASRALNIAIERDFRTQVFQSSICNWRCWYCFVDFKLLAGNKSFSRFLTCEEIIDLYLEEKDAPLIIDLTGGQPDLTPEWVPWMMETLISKNLDNKIYLWSDDNLSNDYLWKYLDNDQLALLGKYKMYSRVCCFKGFNEETFSQNTLASPEYFENQFHICKKLIELNIDLYCYITLTANTKTNFEKDIPIFLDKAQEINELLPLRMVPLKIREYNTVIPRLNSNYEDLYKGQLIAIEIWQKEIQKRYKSSLLSLPITSIELL